MPALTAQSVNTLSAYITMTTNTIIKRNKRTLMAEVTTHCTSSITIKKKRCTFLKIKKMQDVIFLVAYVSSLTVLTWMMAAIMNNMRQPRQIFYITAGNSNYYNEGEDSSVEEDEADVNEEDEVEDEADNEDVEEDPNVNKEEEEDSGVEDEDEDEAEEDSDVNKKEEEAN